jgi:hypothetical protein
MRSRNVPIRCRVFVRLLVLQVLLSVGFLAILAAVVWEAL